MSAELSAAHNFLIEREREHERHFSLSDPYSELGKRDFSSTSVKFDFYCIKYGKSSKPKNKIKYFWITLEHDLYIFVFELTLFD